MRWPAWLRPGGDLAAGYDVPDRPIGVEALRAARAATEIVKASGMSGAEIVEASRAAVRRPAQYIGDPDGWTPVTLTDDQVDRLSQEAGIEAGRLASVIEKAIWDVVRITSAEADELATRAFALHNPAPGLEEVNAAGVPSWAEMQAKYPPYVFDREKARAAVAAAKLADVPPPPMQQVAEHAKAAAEAHYATQAGEVDFRHMLKDDAAAWSAKARIEKVLGRPYLATQLADQLAPDTAAALADRLESLVSQAVAETEMRLSAETSKLVTEKIAEIRATRTSPAEAVSRERFNTPSRFS